MINTVKKITHTVFWTVGACGSGVAVEFNVGRKIAGVTEGRCIPPCRATCNHGEVYERIALMIRKRCPSLNPDSLRRPSSSRRSPISISDKSIPSGRSESGGADTADEKGLGTDAPGRGWERVQHGGGNGCIRGWERARTLWPPLVGCDPLHLLSRSWAGYRGASAMHRATAHLLIVHVAAARVA